MKFFTPACGCDGVSFYNTTIAQSHGMAIRYFGECQPADDLACDNMANPCGALQKCNAKIAAITDCPAAPNQLVNGVCWGVPIACDPLGLQARGCMGAMLGPCADTCSLISSQNPWYADSSCP